MITGISTITNAILVHVLGTVNYALGQLIYDKGAKNTQRVKLASHMKQKEKERKNWPLSYTIQKN